jgi:hypothetical protein
MLVRLESWLWHGDGRIEVIPERGSAARGEQLATGATMCIKRAHSGCACSVSKEGTWPFLPKLVRSSWEGGLFVLPLRAFNEGLLRPRVARAQESNRPPSHSQRSELPFEELLREGHMLYDVCL